MDNLARFADIAAELPESLRVDIEAWDGQPTFRVRGKNFLFTDQEGTRATVKLPPEEAAAVVALGGATPAGYGLGKHGWVSTEVDADADDGRWAELREMIRTSYRMVAPKRLAREVED
ncbi:MAG TPA: MmcQ/YjbR family DNA-binding protein [Umezawaea sp.]|nr:MmcQ/YjbR family DNA-binding protein [Umezawaea sp.]